MHRPDLVALVDALGPNPERAQILEEFAGDLEEMREELVRRGMSPDDADAEALRLLAPSETALAALASVHEPLYASLGRRFSSGMGAAEWAGLVGVTVAAVALALGSLVRAGVLRSPSPFMAPLLVVTIAVLIMVGRKTIQLHVARDHRPDRLHAGMGSLLFGSALAVLLALGGAAVEAFRLASRLQQAPERMVELLLPWLLDTSVLICTGLVTALVGGLAWFLLQQKISAVEGADLMAARAVGRATASAHVHLDHPIPTVGVSP